MSVSSYFKTLHLLTVSVALQGLVAIGLPASAASPTALESRLPRKVVAHSNEQTAATGRQPLSARLVLARQALEFCEPEADQPQELAVAVPQDRQQQPRNEQVTADAELGTAEATAADSGKAVDDPERCGAGSFPSLQSSGGFFYPLSSTAGLPVHASSSAAGSEFVMAATLPRQAFSNKAAITIHVSESQPQAPRGTAVEWHLRLCNTSSETARNVSAVLFFAEGIEPVAASGSTAAMAEGEVRFAPLAELAAGETLELQVTGICVGTGDVAYRAEAACSEQSEPTAHDGVMRVTDALESR